VFAANLRHNTRFISTIRLNPTENAANTSSPLRSKLDTMGSYGPKRRSPVLFKISCRLCGVGTTESAAGLGPG
jgi:hypothetical protein